MMKNYYQNIFSGRNFFPNIHDLRILLLENYRTALLIVETLLNILSADPLTSIVFEFSLKNFIDSGRPL